MQLTTAEKTLQKALTNVGANNLAKSFNNIALPTRKNEAYHYSDLKMLIDNVPNISTKAIKSSFKPKLNLARAFHILIINGEVQINDIPPSGVVVSTSKGGISEPENDIIAKLNSSLTKETLNIDVKGDLDNIIYIERRNEGEANHINSSVEIFILENSNATIIESFLSSDEAHFSNNASKVTLEKGAKASHIMADLSSKKSTHLQTLSYDLEEDANLHSLIIHKGAKLARTQLFANFNGKKSHADFSGLILAGDRQHSDITIDVRHNQPNTTSTENFKSVVRDEAKAIFQGKILVARDAQKVDAKMMHQGLMLSDNSQILVKPELEIYADDVICGHGATCGELDENSLFYLMSRGIEHEQAKSMLVRAFLAEIFDAINNQQLNEELIKIADDWLAKS